MLVVGGLIIIGYILMVAIYGIGFSQIRKGRPRTYMLDYASLRPWEWKPKTEKPKVEKPKSEKPVKTEKPPKPKKVKKRFFLIGAKGRTEIPAELANQMRSSQFYKEGSIIEE